MPRGERIAKPAEWGHPHGRFISFSGENDRTRACLGDHTTDRYQTGVAMPVEPQAVWSPWTRVAARRWAMSVVRKKSWSLVACCVALGAAACGGKESGTGPAADYTLALAPGALRMIEGGTGFETVTITRTTFTGAVTLSLGNAPAGVTGSFEPAGPTGTSSTLTVSVAAAGAPGGYNLTVDGTATARNRSTPLTPTLNSSGGGSSFLATAIA